VCDYKWVLVSWLDLSHTYTTHYYTSQITTWHAISSQSITVITSRCLIMGVNNDYSSASVLKFHTELLSTVNSQLNRVPGWQPLHTDLLVFSLHADLELNCPVNWTVTHQPATSCHFTQLNCSTNCLQNNSSAWTMQKTQPLYCCRGVLTTPLHSSGCGMNHMENTVLLLLQA
jgi:hypothetical protein